MWSGERTHLARTMVCDLDRVVGNWQEGGQGPWRLEASSDPLGSEPTVAGSAEQ